MRGSANASTPALARHPAGAGAVARARGDEKASIRVLFNGHDLKFLRNIIHYFTHAPGYQVRIDEWAGHNTCNVRQSQEMLDWADVIFCEWCLGNATWYAARKRQNQRLFIRLHHQEMELPYRRQLNWNGVDAIIFTNFAHFETFRREQPEGSRKAVVVFCDVDCDALGPEKLDGAEFNLGLVGINPMRKRPDLAVEILRTLRELDSRYALFFKTRMPWEYAWLWQRPAERAYYEQFFADVEAGPLRNSIAFDPHGDDMAPWYTKVGFILSTSDHEGSHQAVAEGMAAGCIPIIRDWSGATPLYPERFVFSSAEQAALMIRDLKTPERYMAAGAEARGHALRHFHTSRVITHLERLFQGEQPEPCRAGVTTDTVEAPGASVRRTNANVASSEERVRVMVLCYLPPEPRGGYRVRVEQMVRALRGHGALPSLLCLCPTGILEEVLTSHRIALEALGCSVHLIPAPHFFDPAADGFSLHGILDAGRRIVERTGVRLMQCEALYCMRVGLLLRERCPGLRLVFDCHGVTPDEERMGGAHPSRISAMTEWERRALAEADLNVFVSAEMHAFYKREYGFADLPHVILPCCVSDERFPDESAGPAVPVPVGKAIIAYLGTMAAWQCGEEMIRLFGQLHRHDPTLYFLLLIPRTDHAKAQGFATRYGLVDESYLLMELAHDDVAATLQHAHAGVLLRRAHPVNQVSSPTKFGEYLAAGLPVIMTTGIGDFSELARSAGLGPVLPPELLDAEEFPTRVIEELAEFLRGSMRSRAQYRSRCQTVAREQLHWRAATDTLFRAYRRLLGSGARRN